MEKSTAQWSQPLRSTTALVVLVVPCADRKWSKTTDFWSTSSSQDRPPILTISSLSGPFLNAHLRKSRFCRLNRRGRRFLKQKYQNRLIFALVVTFFYMLPLLSKYRSYTVRPRPAWFKGGSISVVQGLLKKKSPNQYCETFWGSRGTLTLSAESSDNLWKNMA